jgi:acetyl-CoA C-acetyltransferase
VAGGTGGERIPVIVGIGQVANKDPERILSPLDLARAAVDLAVDDTAVKLGPQIDAVYITPASVFAKRTLADELAEELHVDRGPRVCSSFSGAAPMSLLAQACTRVVAGEARVALVAGALAEASFKRATAKGLTPVSPQAAPWSQGTEGRREYQLDDARARHFRGAEMAAGVTGPGEIFALLESAFAADAGRTPPAQREWLGSLMAPFTEVAATHPDIAWFPVVRTAAELSTAGPDNRLVSEPYPKLMNSFPIVDLAAAMLVTTEAHADALGIAREARVYPWSTSHCADVIAPSGRPALHRSDALRAAVQRALRNASQGIDDIGAFDLYSCFPAAVQLSLDALGVRPDDERRLTLTGGLPYFGGPGANYVTHAIACAVERARREPSSTSLVVGLGGAPSDYATGVFAAAPPSLRWTFDECVDVRDELEAACVPIDNGREGAATVDAMTVVHDRDDGPVRVPLIASFEDGARVGATSPDASLARDLSETSLVGAKVRIWVRDGRSYFEPI